jgi:hypothetical protein
MDMELEDGVLLMEVIIPLDDKITNVSFIASGYILVVQPAVGLDGLQLCSFPSSRLQALQTTPLVARVIWLERLVCRRSNGAAFALFQ